MTNKHARLLAVLSAVITAMSAILFSAMPANAAPVPDSAQGRAGTTSVGVGTWVSSNRTLYQCPETFCNQGQAYPGNNLTTVCYLYSAGQWWDLVYNRANTHSGFIPSTQLAGPTSTQPCATVGHGSTVLYSGVPMYQCPATYCNQGVMTIGDDVAAICYVDGLTGPRIWAFNHANGHEGFVEWGTLSIGGSGTFIEC